MLLPYIKDINKPNRNGITILMRTAESGKFKEMRRLITSGVNLFQADYNGKKPYIMLLLKIALNV